ncbi:MAG: pucL 2 [Ilumatobacteraceae bacterium]|nr:pucL 2 [Ilumatobacteraceae bacterium]
MADDRLSVAEVNDLDPAAFVRTFGGVYESTPELAAAAYARGPFADFAALVDAFDTAASALDDDAALALLRAHPVLGAAGPMARASQQEQASAGLTEIEQDRRDRLRADNALYLERFGFPFIIAVTGLTVADIDAALSERLRNTAGVELTAALTQVRRIAAIRIEKLVTP